MGLCAQALAFPGTPVSSIRCAWKGRKITKSHWRSPLRGISSDKQRPDQDTEQHPGGHRVRPEGGARGGVGLAELRLFMSRCREKSARQSERQGSLRPWELARDAGGQARRAAPGTWRAAVSESREELGEEDAPHPPSLSPSLTPPDVSGGQGSF